MGRLARAVMVIGGTAILVALPREDYVRLWSETFAVSQRAAALVNTHIVRPIKMSATRQYAQDTPAEDKASGPNHYKGPIGEARPAAQAPDSINVSKRASMLDETAREKIGEVRIPNVVHTADDRGAAHAPVREVALNENEHGARATVVPVSDADQAKTNAVASASTVNDASGDAIASEPALSATDKVVTTANVDGHIAGPSSEIGLVAPKPYLARPPVPLPVKSETMADHQAKTKAAVDPRLPPLPVIKPEVPEERKPIPAKMIFGAAKTPAPLAARAIGFYSRGCLAGGKALPIDGPAWQAMRLSRNRNWGHPKLIELLERFAGDVQKFDGWPGLLVGDISQPRGGPMLTGHASHQVGLDADIWFTPMPGRRLSRRERERLSATSMLDGPTKVNPNVFTPSHVKVVKRAASYPQVERILVHPAIKKALCEAAGDDRAWLGKVRPYFGHYYHFHLRLSCPEGSSNCRAQKPPTGDDGCGKEIDYWFKVLTRPKPKPQPKPKMEAAKPRKPKPVVTLSDMPEECQAVLASGEGTLVQNRAELIKSSVAQSKKIIDISGKPRSKIRPR